MRGAPRGRGGRCIWRREDWSRLSRRPGHRSSAMVSTKYIPLILKQVWRHRTRSLLTIGGVAVAMFLFISVQAMQQGVREATETTAADTTLIVYRENRFCPATSRLPEYY